MTSWQHYESLKTRIVVLVENPDPLNPDPCYRREVAVEATVRMSRVTRRA